MRMIRWMLVSMVMVAAFVGCSDDPSASCGSLISADIAAYGAPDYETHFDGVTNSNRTAYWYTRGIGRSYLWGSGVTGCEMRTWAFPPSDTITAAPINRHLVSVVRRARSCMTCP